MPMSLEREVELGLYDPENNTQTPLGAAAAAAGNLPPEKRVAAMDAFKQGLLQSDLSPTQKGKLAMMGRENVLRADDPQLFAMWKEYGLEDEWKSGQPETSWSDTAKSIVTELIPNAAKATALGAKMAVKSVYSQVPVVSKFVDAPTDAETAELFVMADEYWKEGMRTPLILSTGLAKAINDRNPIASEDSKNYTDWLYHSGQQKINDLDQGQAMATAAAVFGMDNPDIYRQITAASGASMSAEKEAGLREKGSAAGQILGPFDVASELATMGAGAGLSMGRTLANRIASAQRMALEAAGKKAALESTASALEGVIKTGSGASRAVAKKQYVRVMGQIAKATDEAASLQAHATTLLEKAGDPLMSKALRYVPGKVVQGAGSVVEKTGKILEWAAEKTGVPVQAIGAVGGWSMAGPLGGAVGLMAKGSNLTKVGKFVHTLGEEFVKRRSSLPYWNRVGRKVSEKKWLAVAGMGEVLAKPVALSGRLGKAAVQGMAAAAPFTWMARGGEDGWMSDAVGMGAVFGTAGQVFGLVSEAAGMPAHATVKDFQRMQAADALNLREVLDPRSLDHFKKLPVDVQRAMGTYAAGSPDLVIRIDDNYTHSSYDPNTKTVRIKPDSKNPLGPLLAHEMSHFVADSGMANTITAELIGDGGMLRMPDGSLSPDFVKFKDFYTDLVKKTDPDRAAALTDHDIAQEWFAEAAAPGMSDSVLNGQMQRMIRRDPLTRSLVNALARGSERMTGGDSIATRFLLKSGVLLGRDGRPVRGVGALGGSLAQSPAIARMVDMHLRKVAGKRTGEGLIPRNGKTPKAVVHEARDGMGAQYQTEADGVTIKRDSAGRGIPLDRDTIRLRETQAGATIEAAAKAAGVDPVVTRDGKTYQLAPSDWAKVIAQFKKEGYLSPQQIKLMQLATEIIHGENGMQPGTPLLMSYQSVYKTLKSGKKSVPRSGLSPEHRVFVPYDVAVTNKGNVLIRSIDRDQLAANVKDGMAHKEGRAIYGGDNASLWQDVNTMLENHQKGQPNDVVFGERKLNFLNALFGDVGKGQKDVNPTLGTLKLRSVIRTPRLDRINKVTPVANMEPTPFNQPAMAERLLPEPVFHGTPHKVGEEGFSMDKIGTGEGAQAYGHGLYFAESQAVGVDYQKGLSGYIAVDGNVIHKNNRTVGTTGDSGLDDLLVGNRGDIDAAIKDAQDGLQDYIPKLEALRDRVDVSTNGNLYKVHLKPKTHEFLDWDKPLSEQSEVVRKALPAEGEKLGNGITVTGKMRGEQLYNAFNEAKFGIAGEASAALHKAGIKGIRYLDGNSRGKGKGSNNYVIFDDADVVILEENGKPVTGKARDEALRDMHEQGGFHGTNADSNFTEFKRGDLGIHFGTKDQASFKNEKVMAAHLNLGRNIKLKEDHGFWLSSDTIPLLVDAGLPKAKLDALWEKKNAESLNASHSAQIIADGLIEMGVDSISYPNKYEGSGDSVMVLSPSQVKSAAPITYRPDGSPVGLADRFDSGNDIRGAVK
jgi:hypothetical protein